MNKKPKALYIPRGYSHAPLKKRIFAQWQHLTFYQGQEGYFEEGLYTEYDVVECTAHQFYTHKMWKREDIDVFVVNAKMSQEGGISKRGEMMRDMALKVSGPKVLFDGSDQAGNLSGDDVLDAFDLVFKREYFKDLDRYPISQKNKKKLRTTMLVCPLLIRPRVWWARMLIPFIKKSVLSEKNDDQKYDVFFSGAVIPSNTVRLDVWNRIVESKFNSYGGLQTKFANSGEIPEKLRFGKLDHREYVSAIRNAKINLALDGIGEFTFRHLELWYLGEFMISSSSIRDLALPLPAKEGVHYVSYDTLDDLVEKVRYYLDNDEERERIARAGKEMFDTYYDPIQHGKDIQRSIEHV